VGSRASTAAPAIAPTDDELSGRRPRPGVTCRVLVIDTGGTPDIFRAGADAASASAEAARAVAMLERCIVPSDPDVWDGDNNGMLDPSGGHGTFIAGIFANLAPGAEVTCVSALSSYGDTDDALIAQELEARFTPDGSEEPPFDIVTMSFGGYCDDDDPPIAIAAAIAKIQSRYNGDGDELGELIRDRVVFVASAGNDASCRPNWPASFENVIGVGALGPTGPAWFTNYGPWVNACAPGVDVVSTFFDLGEGAGDDGEDFDGWAKWSGTSFSGPIVAASIAWEWMNRERNGRPGDAAAWLLDRPGHFRHPGLGTVVNTP
jgi:subtilisin family serine protease